VVNARVEQKKKKKRKEKRVQWSRNETTKRKRKRDDALFYAPTDSKKLTEVPTLEKKMGQGIL